MAENLTADQVRAKKIAAMPAPLGELHYALWNEVAWLHLKWKNYRLLFGQSEERIQFLNEVAGVFFGDLQRVLWEDVLLHLCRLTDPVQSVGKDNLTIRRLHVADDAKFDAELQVFVELAVERTKFARDWRNRRLAHKELPPLDGSESTPIAAASREQVEKALVPIRDAMNCIERKYEESTVSYEHAMHSPHGVESLLYFLEKGLKAQRREDQDLLAGKWNPVS